MITRTGTVIVVTLALALAACGSDGGPASTKSTTAATSTPSGTDPIPEPTTPHSEMEPWELLIAFIDARVAGEGAEQFLGEEGVPLLYATTSGSSYERGEYEQVMGIEWPYGFIPAKVRMFAGDTVVEQLLFVGGDGPRKLEYQPDGFGTHIAPTTEDGQPVAMTYNVFDGEVTLRIAHPWVFHGGGNSFWFMNLIPEGPGVGPTTDGGDRIDWDELFLMADPALLGADCQTGPSPVDAAALAESIRSDPDLGATAPVVVSVGGAEALMMDVVIAAGATVCVPMISGGDPLQNAVLRPVVATGHATGERMRLYLFDVPEGSPMRVLAIAIVAPGARFERVIEAAAPVLDSFEFHAG